MKKPVKFFLIWLGLTIISATVAITYLHWLDYYHLVNRGVETNGLVTAKEPDNHNFIRYSYSVNQHAYDGLGNAGNGNPEFNVLTIGDHVKVFYDPLNPEKSFLGDPSRQLRSITHGVVFITILVPLFLMIGLRIKKIIE